MSDDLNDLRVEIAIVQTEVKHISEEIVKINTKLDALAELNTSARIKLAVMLALGAVSGGAGSVIMNLLGG